MTVIIDYGMGNLGSIRNMIAKVGGQASVSSSPAEILRAERIILPGVGHFDRAMERLNEQGLVEVLHQRVVQDRVPTLGVCLGMQLMTESSEEGSLPGLGWIKGKCLKFQIDRQKNAALRVPHMGWNSVVITKPSPLFDDDGLDEHRFYFVHSYWVECADPADVLCRTTYGHSFVSAFARDNIVGMQFHPEKSHKFGMSVFRRFLEMPAGVPA